MLAVLWRDGSNKVQRWFKSVLSRTPIPTDDHAKPALHNVSRLISPKNNVSPDPYAQQRMMTFDTTFLLDVFLLLRTTWDFCGNKVDCEQWDIFSIRYRTSEKNRILPTKINTLTMFSLNSTIHRRKRSNQDLFVFCAACQLEPRLGNRRFRACL